MSTDVRVRVTPVRVQDGPASCSMWHDSGPSTPITIADDNADGSAA